jgi:outer membrane protein
MINFTKTVDRMKNGLLVWNIVLTLVAGYLLVAHFSKKSTPVTEVKTSTVKGDGAAVSPGALRIAYFEMDSVEESYDMVKDVKSEINRKEEEYNKEVDKQNMPLREKYIQYQNAKTAAEQQSLQQELEMLDRNVKAKRQELDQQYQNFVTQKNLKLRRSLEDFLEKYNKDRKYTYIIAYEQGLFYYKDSAYNITTEVIRGLNEEYAKNKSKKE